MKNYIQSQEFQSRIKDIAYHAFFKKIPKEENIENTYLAQQVHSSHVIEFREETSNTIEADAIVTTQTNINLAVCTADCVPILLIDLDSCVIGVIHAGWRGAQAGIIENTLRKMNAQGAHTKNIIAAIGPCIRQESYEINKDFFTEFIRDDNYNKKFFITSNKTKLFDLPSYIKHKLRNIKSIYDCGINTYINPEDFASYRFSTHQNKVLLTKNISTIRLLPWSGGFHEWKSSLHNIKRSDSNKVIFPRQYSYNLQDQGNDNIATTLDLHGYSKEGAYNILHDFVKHHHEMGNRSLLIITGKGTGIIKESVHKWLEYSNFSKYVLRFSQAKIKDGGEGALYLNLKKREY